MINEQNLVQNQGLTREEARALSRKGGIRSGEVRRARKTLKEELLLLLETDNRQERMSIAILEKAISGDTKAFETIRDTIGEKQSEKQEIKAETDNKFEVNIKVVE